jgi:pimeloyl-ACP methyl ester carboxylesterase
MAGTLEQITVAGLRIAYVREGSGPPLLLLHGGFGLDHRSWGPQIEGMSDEFTVVAWDAPGVGGSSDPADQFRLADYADCLAGFLAAVGLEHPHVLGLSWGGALALELYRRHPALPRSLVLAGAYAGWAGSLPPAVVQERLARFLDEMDRPPMEWIPGYISGLLTANASREVVAELTSLMSDVRPVGAAIMLQAMAEADLRDVLPRVAVPTLLIYGEFDVRSPLAVGEALHASIPGSSLVVLRGVGHASSFEVPDEFNRAVRSFLGAVPR